MPPRPSSAVTGRSRRLQRGLAWVSVAAVVASAIGLALFSAWREQGFEERRDEALSERAGALLEMVVSSSIASLKGIEGLVDEAGGVDGEAFERFAEAAVRDTPLVSMGYQRLVLANEREGFEAETGLTITERAGETLVPADEHAVYLPAEHVYSHEVPVADALGFDLANDPDRRPAVLTTLEERAPTITGPMALADSNRSGLMVVHPAVIGDEVVGTVAAAMLTDELGDQVELLLPSAVDVAVASEDGALLDGPASGGTLDDGATSPVAVAGMTFLVSADDHSQVAVVVPLTVLAVGLALAAGLAGLFTLSWRSQRVVEAAERRAEALLEVTSLLSRSVSSQEVAVALASRARAVVGATGCVVAGVDPDGSALELLATEGVPAPQVDHVDGLALDDGTAVVEAVRRRRTLWRDASADWNLAGLRSPFGDPAGAAVVIPLIAGGQPVGVVGFTYASQHLDDAQRSITDALATQAARAMGRARAYDREHQIAEALQRRLLPPTMPVMPGLEVEAVYRAGAVGTVVGGDWYDALLDDGGDHMLVVVGDVVGSGPAAAATMGELRAALGVTSQQHRDPVRVVEGLDAFAASHPDAFGSTCCVVEVRGDGRLTYARAGHLPPLVVGPRGIRFLEGAGLPPLGVRRGAPADVTAAEADLVPGETLLLYTDGAVERRGEHIDVGLARLAQLAAERCQSGPVGLCVGLLEDLLADHDPRDDVAIVVVQRSAPAASSALGASSASGTTRAAGVAGGSR